MERGPGYLRKPEMTLTYRGQQYAPCKGATTTSNRPALTYRGIAYAK
ncbi:MAG: DUF4278 domain-containing protein [Synechococcus sp. MED-G71]|jgi:hypothetical protein|nr:MAG: DUF4278 domain-containing protein [Synechococcus sp. MED-G71]RPF75415.1 MAG: DUF4278 domain-containing protein [Synechococcus sp. TMED155]